MFVLILLFLKQVSFVYGKSVLQHLGYTATFSVLGQAPFSSVKASHQEVVATSVQLVCSVYC